MTPSLTSLLLDSDRLECYRAAAPPEWTELLLGERDVVYVTTAQWQAPSCGQPGTADLLAASKAIFPGSFNPLHDGHARMARIASEWLSQDVWLEVSIANVDKPPLDFLTIRERLDQFDDYNVCLTRAATFVEKAELFPDVTFVVGVDTLARIADERYYHGEKKERDAAIARLEQSGARFLVFGRADQGRFETLDNLALPGRLAAMCDEVPEAEFRDDVSSTELRNTKAAADAPIPISRHCDH